MQAVKHWFWTLAIFGAATVPAVSQTKPSTQPQAIPRQHLADYDAEVRRPDGHVDADTLLKRLKELGVDTYYWLIWHKATDWDDLKVFLPKASRAGIDVWVYLVPPTESAEAAILRAVSHGLRSLGRGDRSAFVATSQPQGVGDRRFL